MNYFWNNSRLQPNAAGSPVSATEYASAKKKLSAYRRCTRSKRSEANCYEHAGISGVDDANRLQSSVEVYDFVKHPPERYFLYIDESSRKATTWTGEVLGDVSFGREYRANTGDRRVPVRIRAINGRTYTGTYFKSAGDYARVRMVK